MEGDLFSKVHVSLTSTLALQKANSRIADATKVVEILLQEGCDQVGSEEWDAVRSAVIVASTVACRTCLSNKSWKENSQYLLPLFKLAFQLRSDVNSPLLWDQHLKPLLSIILSDFSMETHSIALLIETLNECLRFIFFNRNIAQGFLSVPSIPLFGKLVTVLLDVVSDNNQNPKTRTLALNIIRLPLEDKELKASTCRLFSIILPGIVSKLSVIATKSSTDNVEVIITTTQLFFDSIKFCLEDGLSDDEDDPSEVNQSIKQLIVRRDKTWIEKTTINIVPLIRTVVSHLCIHRDHVVRLRLFEGLSDVALNCSESFGSQLDDVFFDTVLVMSRDSFPSVIEPVKHRLELIKTSKSSSFYDHLYKKMKIMGESMPISIRKSLNSYSILNQFVATISCLSSHIPSLVLTRSPLLIQSIRSLASSIRIDIDRLQISRNENIVDIKSVLYALPLKYGVQMTEIEMISEELAASGQSEMVDLLLNEVRDSCDGDKIGLSIILTFVLSYLSSDDVRDHKDVVSNTIEYCITEIDETPLPALQRDEKIEDLSMAASQSTISSIAIICLITCASNQLQQDDNVINVHRESLYRLLQLCSHSNWLIQQTSHVALTQLSQTSYDNLSAFLMDNCLYVINKISLFTRCRKNYKHAPCVLSTLLDIVQEEAMFQHVRFIIDDVLIALDSYDQEYTYVVLRSILSFVRAMNRWFPDIRPMEQLEEINEDSQELGDDVKEVVHETPPDTVLTVEKVLQRTKHLLASPHFPVKIVVLEIVKEGFHFLRNFDNTLLPMLHQNWLSLIHRFKESNIDVWRASFELVHEMAMVANTFVYRRIRDELWPKVSKWMLTESANQNFVVFSSRFKFMKTVLERMSDIFIQIDVDETDWTNISPVLHAYCQPFVHSTLKKLAEDASIRIRAHIDAKIS